MQKLFQRRSTIYNFQTREISVKTTSSIIKVPNDIKTIVHYIFNYSTPVWVSFLADIRKDLLRVMYRMSNGRDPDGQDIGRQKIDKQISSVYATVTIKTQNNAGLR